MEFIQDIPLFPLGLLIININIKLKVRKPFANTNHFIKFRRKSSGFKLSFSNFFEEVYVVYINGEYYGRFLTEDKAKEMVASII